MCVVVPWESCSYEYWWPGKDQRGEGSSAGPVSHHHSHGSSLHSSNHSTVHIAHPSLRPPVKDWVSWLRWLAEVPLCDDHEASESSLTSIMAEQWEVYFPYDYINETATQAGHNTPTEAAPCCCTGTHCQWASCPHSKLNTTGKVIISLQQNRTLKNQIHSLIFVAIKLSSFPNIFCDTSLN